VRVFLTQLSRHIGQLHSAKSGEIAERSAIQYDGTVRTCTKVVLKDSFHCYTYKAKE
jgi:hypothetical protein